MAVAKYRVQFAPNPMTLISASVKGVVINFRREFPGPLLTLKLLSLSVISESKQCLVARRRSTSYQKQKSVLEVEFMDFLALMSQRTAVPDDVVDFLLWKDSSGKTVVHCDTCLFLGERSNSSCSCPKRLAYGSVDSTIGKVRAIFNKYGRTAIDDPFLRLANPTASPEVKSYLSAIREEQLVARVVRKQAEPFIFRDLVILSSEILRRMTTHLRSPSQSSSYFCTGSSVF